MKEKFLLLLLAFLPLSAFCQQKWLLASNDNDIQAPETVYSNVTIDKKACTITVNGKTFKLYGKVQIVDNWPDIKVEIVSSFPDLKAKIVDNWADSCGEFIVTDSWPDLKVQIVTSFPDLKVRLVENWPGF